MKIQNFPLIFLTVVVCLPLVLTGVSCGSNQQDVDVDEPSPPATNTAPVTPSVMPSGTPREDAEQQKPSPAPQPPQVPAPELKPYDGVVEHLFFHEVIAYPELAFDGDSMQPGYDANMVTASEFSKMLESMHRNNFILVNMNDVWSEFTDTNGVTKMQKNTLMLPDGKKPLILSFDDICFYEYMRGDGFMEKLIIGRDGDIWASGYDPAGNDVLSQDFTVVTILDKFVREHPDFSLDGVKGCLALTGYEGILGYRTQADTGNNSDESRLNRMQEVARARPVVQRLQETGWYFATHSYGHIDLNNMTLDGIKADALRWLDEVGSLVGETKIFIYAYGARPDGGDVYDTGPVFRFYHDLGFRLFASVGFEPFSRIKSDISAVVCDRMHADGGTLRRERERYMKFYDAAEVFDPLRPAIYGTNW